MVPPESGWPNHSRFTFVELPGTELLAQEGAQGEWEGGGFGALPAGLKPRAHAALVNSMFTFARVAAQLAQQTDPDRVTDHRYAFDCSLTLQRNTLIRNFDFPFLNI